MNSSLPQLLLVTLLAAIPAGALTAAELKSGYEFIKPETRAMQDDDFENPGMLAVEQGKDLFNNKQDGASKACADCHGSDGEKLDTGNIARYPVYNKDLGGIVTLQQRIRICRDNPKRPM